MIKTKDQLVKALNELIKLNVLTEGIQADEATLLTFIEFTGSSVVYHQYAYEQLPAYAQQAFRNHKKGDTIKLANNIQITGVYDIWGY